MPFHSYFGNIPMHMLDHDEAVGRLVPLWSRLLEGCVECVGLSFMQASFGFPL